MSFVDCVIFVFSGLVLVGLLIYESLKNEGFISWERTSSKKPLADSPDVPLLADSPDVPPLADSPDVPPFEACEDSEHKDVVFEQQMPIFHKQPKILRSDYLDFLNSRGIKYLVHFTAADNLASIFKRGIVPRSEHEIFGLNSFYNDFQRLDGHLGATSFTFSFPNYKYFYSLRNRFPDRDFVVLLVDAKVVCELRSAFYSTNAASFSVTKSVAHENVNALKLMFEEPYYGMPSRRELAIPSYYTTDPQAEVMVYGTIPANYIRLVCFPSEHTLKRYTSVIPDGVLSADDYRLFGPRLDAKCWQHHSFRKEPEYDRFEDLRHSYGLSSSSSVVDVFAPTLLPKEPDEKFIVRMNVEADKNVAALNAKVEPSCEVCMEYIREDCFGGGLCPAYRYSGRGIKQ